MAGEVIHAARYAKHPTSEIAGVTHAGITPVPVASKDPGAAADKGTKETVVTDRDIQVSIYGQDFVALMALLEATAANVVVGIKGPAGANEKITVKSVYFDQWLGEIAIKPRDAGGTVPRFGVRGTAQWGSTDTFPLMIVAAADA